LEGQGINQVRVTVTNAAGETRTAVTSPFGYYRIDDVAAGEGYTITASSKRYSFDPPVIFRTVLDDVTDADFRAVPLSRPESISPLISRFGINYFGYRR
jgi:hypothetical protein